MVTMKRRSEDGELEIDLDVFVQMFMPDGFFIHGNPARSNVAPFSTERNTSAAKTKNAALRYRA